MKLKKNDFIEIEFAARIKKTGEVFDSNIKKEIEKLGGNLSAKPFIFPLGNSMFLEGVEDFLMNSDIDSFPKSFKIELSAEKAFGKRDPKLVRLIPSKSFKEHNLNPVQGDVLNFDGQIGKVIAVSGGRVLVDFNNPVAGKDVIYEVKILRKIDNIEEKVKSLFDFFFKKSFDFDVSGGKIAISLKKDESQFRDFISLFNDKFKEILGLELEVEETKEEKQLPKNAKEENKDKTGNY